VRAQIPAFFLSKLARQHVAVAFTGDGAAEPFGGGQPGRTAQLAGPVVGRADVSGLEATLIAGRLGSSLGTLSFCQKAAHPEVAAPDGNVVRSGTGAPAHFSGMLRQVRGGRFRLGTGHGQSAISSVYEFTV
jgi:asparagine synthetase B (glutamine-hydrolysing)